MTNKSFSDLTRIDVPFGELDIETKLALHRAFYERGKIERRGLYGDWDLANNPGWYLSSTYRLQPEPLRNIAPPWHVMNPDIKWVARDEGGEVYGYEGKPAINNHNGIWSVTGSTRSYPRLDNLLTFDHGNKPWNESLVQRPVKDEDLI